MKKFLLSIMCIFGATIAMNAQTENLITNSGFEEWSDSKPTDWIESTSVSNATVEQSTDAHTGNYSVVVKGTSSSNKRFASKKYTLAAGTYVISAYVKTNGSEAGHYRLGYVKVTADNKADGSYNYDDDAAQAAPTSWTEATFEFTLQEESTISILIMNNKNGKGASFLVDDFTLTAKEGGAEEIEQSTIAEVIASEPAKAKVEGTIVATYAVGFLVNDGTGSILAYLGSDQGYAVGDVVTISGTISSYAGLLQFTSNSVIEKKGTATVTHPTPAVMTAADMEAYLSAPVVKYIEYTGTLSISGNYYNVEIEGTSSAQGSISYPKDGAVTATDGQVVKVTGYAIGAKNGYVNTMLVSIEVVSDGGSEGGEGGEGTTEDIYIEESFATDFGDFTQEQTVGTYEWVIDYNTAKMSSYADGVNNASVSWLISPSVDFTEETQAYIEFEYVIRYENSETIKEDHQLLVSKDFAGDASTATWVALDFNVTASTSFSDFKKASLNIPADYMGESELTFAFKYTGTETNASTWEVRNLIVAHGEVEVVVPEPEPEAQKYNVTEAINAYVDGEQIPVIVTGYIIGAMGSNSTAEIGTTSVATNIIISDNADETDMAKCLIVQLPKGDIRTALNLVDNPTNYKKQVIITGSLEKYFSVAGIKTPTAYEFTGVTSIDKVFGEENAEKTIYDLTGRRINNIVKPGLYIVNGKKLYIK